MEQMVTVYLFGKRYQVPESLTIMEAMEYAGYQLVRGCGCRNGFCGACDSGEVSALKAGTAIITAATAKGLTATCTVTVTANTSGIEGVDGDGVTPVSVESGEIVISGDAEAEVYSLTGARVAVANGGRVSGLPRGVYLVRTGGKTYKLVL